MSATTIRPSCGVTVLVPEFTRLRGPLKEPKMTDLQACREWRDPDSNRGHHDFQPRVLHGRMWPICSEIANASSVAVSARIRALWVRLRSCQAHDREPVPKCLPTRACVPAGVQLSRDRAGA